MTRLVHRPIVVEDWQGEEPGSFRDGSQLHQICGIIDSWRESGEWWSGETERRLLRVLTDKAAVFDLECTDSAWFIYRVWD